MKGDGSAFIVRGGALVPAQAGQLIFGIERTVIDVTSHGEADLLVKTADEVPDPRNRRVEITIR